MGENSWEPVLFSVLWMTFCELCEQCDFTQNVWSPAPAPSGARGLTWDKLFQFPLLKMWFLIIPHLPFVCFGEGSNKNTHEDALENVKQLYMR